MKIIPAYIIDQIERERRQREELERDQARPRLYIEVPRPVPPRRDYELDYELNYEL